MRIAKPEWNDLEEVFWRQNANNRKYQKLWVMSKVNFFQRGFNWKACKQTVNKHTHTHTKPARCFFKAIVPGNSTTVIVVSRMYFENKPCSSNDILTGARNPSLKTFAKLCPLLYCLLQDDKVIGVITRHDKRILLSNCLVPSWYMYFVILWTHFQHHECKAVCANAAYLSWTTVKKGFTAPTNHYLLLRSRDFCKTAFHLGERN